MLLHWTSQVSKRITLCYACILPLFLLLRPLKFEQLTAVHFPLGTHPLSPHTPHCHNHYIMGLHHSHVLLYEPIPSCTHYHFIYLQPMNLLSSHHSSLCYPQCMMHELCVTLLNYIFSIVTTRSKFFFI